MARRWSSALAKRVIVVPDTEGGKFLRRDSVQAIERWKDRAIERSTDRPIDRAIEQSSDRAIKRALERSID